MRLHYEVPMGMYDPAASSIDPQSLVEWRPAVPPLSISWRACHKTIQLLALDRDERLPSSWTLWYPSCRRLTESNIHRVFLFPAADFCGTNKGIDELGLEFPKRTVAEKFTTARQGKSRKSGWRRSFMTSGCVGGHIVQSENSGATRTRNVNLSGSESCSRASHSWTAPIPRTMYNATANDVCIGWNLGTVGNRLHRLEGALKIQGFRTRTSKVRSRNSSRKMRSTINEWLIYLRRIFFY